jgi:hypothetical protein
MLRRRFNLNDLFSEFDSLFDGFNSYNNPMVVRGRKNVESGDDEDGTWTKETFVSEDGSYQVTSLYRYNNTSENKETRDQIKGLEINKEKINELKSQLDEAVSNQDFEKAIKLRDKLKKYNS